MSTLLLIDRQGRTAFRLEKMPKQPGPWIMHDGRRWGFGAGTINGEQSYFEVPPTPPMGNPQDDMAATERQVAK